MSSIAPGTPFKRGNSSQQRRTIDPRSPSFVPLMAHLDADENRYYDSSFESESGDVRDSFPAAFSSTSLETDPENCFADDETTSSIKSCNTDKTSATSTTNSISHSQFPYCSPFPVDIEVSDGACCDADADPSAQQQHPLLANRIGPISRHASDLEFFEDLVSEPVLLLGVDISHLSPTWQFVMCASGAFSFSLLYGYLQELISVQICSRQLGLFLSVLQFTGYTALSFILRTYVYETHQKKHLKRQESEGNRNGSAMILAVPFVIYLGLSLLRAVDLAMTNLAMQYINYPAKTLMKSSRVVFTMIFGVFIARKRYLFMDYFVVLCMVAGLAIFMHADATSSAVFQPLGVIMLTVSLICDGAISNMSESIMKNYGVGQDEFIFRMYSIALVAITAAAAFKGDLQLGMYWLMKPGTYDEMQQGVTTEEASWSVPGKMFVIILFSSMGFFGSSCSAAITKNFGALTMSITSTARKATTLFLSFFLFNNVCTYQHVLGAVIFIAALTAKSLRRTRIYRGKSNHADSTVETPDIEGKPSKAGQRMLATPSKGFSRLSRQLFPWSPFGGNDSGKPWMSSPSNFM